MHYEFAPDLQNKAEEISKIMFPHVKLDKIKCFRSRGSSSRGTIARCHALGKIMQKTIGVDAHYALEFLSERFDKMDEEEKIKVIMHELMHIPKTFGGGFKHHDFVCERNVNLYYKEYKKRSQFNTGDNVNDKKEMILKNERKNNLIFWK
jgi:predicted metallopeptidase